MKTKFKQGDIVFGENHRKVQVQSYLDEFDGYLGYPIMVEYETDGYGDVELDENEEPIRTEVLSDELKFYQKLFDKQTYAIFLEAKAMEDISRNCINTRIEEKRKVLADLTKETQEHQDTIKRIKEIKHQTHLTKILLNLMEGKEIWIMSYDSYKPFISRLSELKENGLDYEKLTRMVYLNYDYKNGWSNNNYEQHYDWKISPYNDSSGSGTTVLVDVDEESLLNRGKGNFLEMAKGKTFASYSGLKKPYEFLTSLGIDFDEKLKNEYDEYIDKMNKKAEAHKQKRIDALSKEIEDLKGIVS